MQTSSYLRVMVMSLFVGALLLSGCNTVRGGGWITSATGTGKATFGFQLVCEDDDLFGARVSGQLQYNDHAAGVSLHGVPDDVELSTCDADLSEGLFTGEYRPQPTRNGAPGRFDVHAVDAGKAGPSTGDEFCISLTGGVYDGYSNCGTLGGGNVQTFK